MKKLKKLILSTLFISLLQSCDCHGVWSQNIRDMNNCLASHKENEQFCLKEMDKVGTCRHIKFEQENQK